VIFDRFLARSVDTVFRTRHHGYDGVGKRRNLSLIPLNYSCVAGMDLLVSLKRTGRGPLAIGSPARGG
jgi:hypothetical protein